MQPVTGRLPLKRKVLERLIELMILRVMLIAAGTVAFSAESVAQQARLIDAGGHRLEMIVHPGPSPSVVFDAGAGGGMNRWAQVPDSVGAHTSIVLFERAGLGNSEVGPVPRTAHRFAMELRTALVNARVEFPIVLVGYSFGGMTSMAFAELFPDDLAGVVLVDPATDLTYQRMYDERPQWLPELIAEVAASVPEVPSGWLAQMEAIPESIAELRDFGPVSGVPFVVLTAMSHGRQWPKATEADMEEWRTDHEALVARVRGARHVIVPEATHGSILRAPAVVQEILGLVDRGRR